MDVDAIVKSSELKQNPSAVLARAEAGQTFIVTVQNRPVATLGPLRQAHRWATRADYEAYRSGPHFSAEAVSAWMADIRSADIDDELRDPFEP